MASDECHMTIKEEKKKDHLMKVKPPTMFNNAFSCRVKHIH